MLITKEINLVLFISQYWNIGIVSVVGTVTIV